MTTNEYRIVREAYRPLTAWEEAEHYRLRQAEGLLREAGYVENDDGIWHLPT